MNCAFDINKLLSDEITKLDNRLQVCRQSGQDRYGYQQLKRMLFEVVDKMGEASAKAQRLTSTITTGTKLENSNHHLYIMKDVSEEKNCVVGILKVGTKKLFVYDSRKTQHEVDPLCVLDFYVHESRQRMGCGKKLFNFMLAHEAIPVQHMAVDRPSPKFQAFLKKHFRLHAQIPQVNNFVVFEGFFNNRNDAKNRQNRFNSSGYISNTANRSQPSSGRKSQTPLSGLHLQPPQQPQPQPQQHQNNGNYSSFPTPASSQYGNRQSPSYMAAGERMYSRHGATPPNPRATPPYSKNILHPSRNGTPPTANINCNHATNEKADQPPLAGTSRSNSSTKHNNTTFNDSPQEKNSALNNYDVNYNKMTSPYMQYALGTKNLSPYYDSTDKCHQLTSAQSVNDGGMSQNLPAINGAHGNKITNGAIFLPDIKSGNSSHQFDIGSQKKNNNAQLPPSGKRTNPPEPPVLQRDGPPAEYRAMMNMHQAYQGRNGRFVVSETRPVRAVSNNSPSSIKPPHRPSTYEQSYGSSNSNSDWKWSVSGHLREQRMKQNVTSKYNPGRLW